MQPVPVDNYTAIPKRALDIEDYLDILRRHKAWILGPTFAALVIAVVVAFFWPDTYVSAAIIRVVPPLVPENYVPTNVNSEISQRVNAMYQTIKSRQSLLSMITTMNLYPRERGRMPDADVVEIMNGAIKLSDVSSSVTSNRGRGITAFQIAFQYENRFLAQKVTKELVTRFLNENQRERTAQSIQTTQFLNDQLDTAKRELEAIEGKLTSYRTSFAGRLPEQVGSNQMQLNAIEQRIANLNMQLNRASQDKMLLESDLRSLKNQRASLNPAPEIAAQRQKNLELQGVERRITQLETMLESLRQNYSDKYPDVVRVKAELAAQNKLRDKLIKQEEEGTTPSASAAGRKLDTNFERESRQLDAAIERIQALIRTRENEMEQSTKNIAAAEKQGKNVQSRLEAAPESEQQFASVIRDREIAKLKYEDLNRRRSASAMAEELEKRNQGETLELLDDASVPQTPTQPKRPMIIAAGTALGLVLGLFLAGAREAKDSSLKNLKDVRAYTQLPILGSVPLLENDIVVRRRRKMATLAWFTACLVGIAIMTGSVFYYYATRA